MIFRTVLASLGSLALLVVAPSAATAAPRVEPAHGSHVDAVPKRVAIHTDLKLTTVYILVQAPDGSIDELKPTIGRGRVTATLPANKLRGEYEVAYRLVASNGDVTPGTIRFTVDKGQAPPAAEGEPAGSQDMPIIGLTLGAGALLALAALLVRRRLAAPR